MDKGLCRSCGAEIRWAVTSGGKKIPLDYPELRFVPQEDGTVAQVRTYLAHFATCPQADRHRKGG